MRIVTSIIFALVLAASTGHSAPVAFRGERPADASAVERLGRSNAPADSVRTLLVRDGYLDAAVSSAADTLVIDAGRRVLLDSLFVTRGSTTVTVIAAPFSEAIVDSLTARLLARESAHGHWYATVVVDSISRTGEKVNVHVQIRPGPVLTVRRIDLRGLVRSRPDLIKRYLPIGSGDTLTNEVVASTEKAAERIDFVRFVPPATILPQAGYTSADLRLDFAENRPLSVELGGGYLPNDTGTQLVWNLNLRFNNLLGSGRQAQILSERREEGRQVLQIGYTQPVFILGSGRFEADVATRDYRSSFYEFGIHTGLSTHFGEQLTGGVDLGFRRVEPADQSPAFAAYRASFLSGWDRLDRPFNPSSGIRFQSSIAYVHRRYDTDSSAVEGPIRQVYNETRADAQADIFQAVWANLVGHISVQYHGLETSEPLPPLSELILVGGPGTLRGYRNEQFAVLRTALFTLEPRERFDAGYFFAFYDGAYLNNRVGSAGESVRTVERFRYGYGIGLALGDTGRSVRLSLAWNPDLKYDQARLSIELSSGI